MARLKVTLECVYMKRSKNDTYLLVAHQRKFSFGFLLSSPAFAQAIESAQEICGRMHSEQLIASGYAGRGCKLSTMVVAILHMLLHA
jgi:hypothetical protein